MNVAELKRASRAGNVRARVISDGCRDYVVQIDHGAGGSLLCNRIKRPMRFRSLGEANALLNRYNVMDRRLAIRIADDEAGLPAEACMPASSSFNDVPLLSQST